MHSPSPCLTTPLPHLARPPLTPPCRKHYVMFGQAQLNVRDVFDFMKKKVFRINFVDKIKYPPLEIKGEFKFHLVPHPVVAALAASNGATVTSMGASVGWEA
jgi:hypothetical protein